MERDLKIHHIVAQAGGNIFYIFILNFFNEIFRQYGDLYFKNPVNRDKTLKFHNDVFELLKSRDSKGAKSIAQNILQFTETVISNINIA